MGLGMRLGTRLPTWHICRVAFIAECVEGIKKKKPIHTDSSPTLIIIDLSFVYFILCRFSEKEDGQTNVSTAHKIIVVYHITLLIVKVPWYPIHDCSIFVY